MVFIVYEPDTKAYRIYDLVGKRVHVTRGVVFDEAAQWDWGTHGNASMANSGETFTIEYTIYPVAGVVHGNPATHGSDKCRHQ